MTCYNLLYRTLTLLIKNNTDCVGGGDTNKTNVEKILKINDDWKRMKKILDLNLTYIYVSVEIEQVTFIFDLR